MIGVELALFLFFVALFAAGFFFAAVAFMMGRESVFMMGRKSLLKNSRHDSDPHEYHTPTK